MKVNDLVVVRTHHESSWNGQMCLVTSLGNHGAMAFVKRLSDGKISWFPTDCLEEAEDEDR